jgi:hypothetical protein
MNRPPDQLQCLELCPICRAAEVLRQTGAGQSREGWQTAQREALLTMRTMIDHLLARMEESSGEEPPPVEEIPID